MVRGGLCCGERWLCCGERWAVLTVDRNGCLALVPVLCVNIGWR